MAPPPHVMASTQPNRSRSRVDWTDDGIARVDDAIERFSFFLAGYSYGGR